MADDKKVDIRIVNSLDKQAAAIKKALELPRQIPVTPEKEKTVEQAPADKEAAPVKLEQLEGAKIGAGISVFGVSGGLTSQQKQRQKQIEQVLASGLEQIYIAMPEEKQRQFKLAGEQTAALINRLLAKAKVKINAIIKLIKKWLSLIPGVNKYFLEQEAKIKADEIIKIKNNS